MNDPLRIDSTKIMFHPFRVKQWLQRKDDWEMAKEIYPLYVEVSPVGACNHRCTFCAVDYIGYKSNMLDLHTYNDRIHEMGALGVKSVMMAGEGEPLLHKHINQMVDSTTAAEVDIAFTTNGVLLDKLETVDQCAWIKVSLNAGTTETYDRVHRGKPGDFERVVAAVGRAVERKGRCTIGLQMVVLPENQHEVELLQRIGAGLGVDYVVAKPYSQHKFSITRQYENFKSIPVVSGVVTRSPLPDAIPYTKCQATPYLWAYIMATGAVYSCSAYLLDDRFELGNINDNTFRDIWHGQKRKTNWEYVRNELDIGECRVNCRMDKTNRYLNELVDGPQHVNFI